ncbi:hypothetical protein WILDE_79 [Arthrobacter phage Wilde]|uniref:Uncharacterized protein n=1 Tax=Arthrobacter phage Wilde TaxID=1772323 RepID=A0A0U4B7X5_9CAUD|nr:hypothetical protein WILDE_79 [Arthrobacter phage Wilde]
MRYEIATAGGKGIDTTISVGTMDDAMDTFCRTLLAAGWSEETVATITKELPPFLRKRGDYRGLLSKDKSYTITITVK